MYAQTTQLQPYTGNVINLDHNCIDDVILQLADTFDIRVVWDRDTALVTGALAVAGGLVGGYAGGRLGAALGAGLGGAAGLGVSTLVSLREIWGVVKEKLRELIYIVFNYLRRLDTVDYERALQILMACAHSRRELVLTILDFIAFKLGREVYSSITAAYSENQINQGILNGHKYLLEEK